jgi:hypothetical protein
VEAIVCYPEDTGIQEPCSLSGEAVDGGEAVRKWWEGLHPATRMLVETAGTFYILAAVAILLGRVL